MNKRCIYCGTTKSLDAFYRVHKNSEDRQSRCKECDNSRRCRYRVFVPKEMRPQIQKSKGRIVAERREDGTIVLVRKATP